MAMRRRVGRSRALTARSAARQFQRKKQTWMNLFNTSCEYILFEPDEEACPNAFQIPLLDSTQTEIFRQDSTTVKRLIIDLLLGPIGFVSTTDVAIQANMMRIALKRWEQPGGAQDPPRVQPNARGRRQQLPARSPRPR